MRFFVYAMLLLLMALAALEGARMGYEAMLEGAQDGGVVIGSWEECGCECE